MYLSLGYEKIYIFFNLYFSFMLKGYYITKTRWYRSYIGIKLTYKDLYERNLTVLANESAIPF